MHSPRRALLIVAALLLWPALLLGQDYQRWYALHMAGQRAGYMHAVRTAEEDRITSSSRMVIAMSRGPIEISISMESQFVETATGRPISMMKIEQMGHIPSRTDYTFGDDELSIRSTQADQVMESTRPLPEGAWLTPAAAEDFLRKRLAANAPEIIMRTLDPTSGPEPTVVKRTGLTKTTLDIMGRTIEVFRCNAESSAMPGIVSTEYLDNHGIPVKLETNIGGLPLLLVMTDQETALAGAGGGAQLAPEMMLRTFIKPDRRIRGARTITTAQYILSVPDGDIPALPQTGVQRIEALDDQRIRVTVDSRRPRTAPDSDRGDPAFLEASTMLNADDPEVRALTRRAITKAGDSPADRAEAMRRFVYEYITSKDLDVGFASASEVARRPQGDCTEHGVLLAAMLRADGIPARVVSGLVYADRFAGERHIFGYHMWTQALLNVDGEDRWVDLDATLERPFDATHIALSVSALRDGEMATSLSAMIPLIGRLQVKVESYE